MYLNDRIKNICVQVILYSHEKYLLLCCQPTDIKSTPYFVAKLLRHSTYLEILKYTQ